MSKINVGDKVLVRHPYTDGIVEGQVISKGVTPIIGQSYYQVEIDKGAAALNLFENEIIVCDE